MKAFLQAFFSSDYIPHGHCYLWQPELVWLHGMSDALIALAYYSIPIFLIYLSYKRSDIPFRGAFWLFGAFIVCCGTTHLLEIWTLWHPVYWLAGGMKAVTAIVSLHAALTLILLTPKALTLPSPAQLEIANQTLEQLNQALEIRVAQRTEELTKTIRQLQNEVEQRQQTENELQRSNQELEQFAYVASHDLQEPLRVIVSYTELLAEKYQKQLDEKANKYITYIVNAATRMQALIEDLLSYSRVGRCDFRLVSTDCDRIVDQVIQTLHVAIAESHATITRDRLPTIEADKEQFSRLLQNLISNAIKYRQEQPPQIHISATQKDNKWLFAVHDNGIGIEAQYAQRIFIIFQRLHTRRQYSGTGLGLAICKKIVERHHGNIWMESEVGKGSVFWFTIPIKKENSQ
ncbi:MAG: ATP-binding protein [Nostoc sp. DedQUE04]|uniref:sensor histidine kinase n=1 Tax=Nostoc sp. DedQUE04 TaxID=3075390 RepID=UPI002AD23BFA|nr:ATP-binding protein [Nostoc sp. DedQUE04]MDZ8136161.1 ATP-binding protein [Nostoc sp. DedQUE04]